MGYLMDGWQTENYLKWLNEQGRRYREFTYPGYNTKVIVSNRTLFLCKECGTVIKETNYKYCPCCGKEWKI